MKQALKKINDHRIFVLLMWTLKVMSFKLLVIGSSVIVFTYIFLQTISSIIIIPNHKLLNQSKILVVLR